MSAQKEREPFRPRLSVEIRQDQYDRLNKIPWGLKRPLFEQVVDDVLTVLDAGGEQAIAAIIAKRMGGYLSIDKEVTNDSSV